MDDQDLKKLRDNLAKYNPGDETADKIVSAEAVTDGVSKPRLR